MKEMLGFIGDALASVFEKFATAVIYSVAFLLVLSTMSGQAEAVEFPLSVAGHDPQVESLLVADASQVAEGVDQVESSLPEADELILALGFDPVGPVLKYIAYLLQAVGLASLLVKLFVYVAKITPNTKDDQYAAVAKRWIGRLVYWLDRLALNPDARRARY